MSGETTATTTTTTTARHLSFLDVVEGSGLIATESLYEWRNDFHVELRRLGLAAVLDTLGDSRQPLYSDEDAAAFCRLFALRPWGGAAGAAPGPRTVAPPGDETGLASMLAKVLDRRLPPPTEDVYTTKGDVAAIQLWRPDTLLTLTGRTVSPSCRWRRVIYVWPDGWRENLADRIDDFKASRLFETLASGETSAPRE